MKRVGALGVLLLAATARCANQTAGQALPSSTLHDYGDARIEIGARGAAIEDVASNVRLAFALHGAHAMKLSSSRAGVEDLVTIDEPGETSLDYDIDVSHVPGLRLVSNV